MQPEVATLRQGRVARRAASLALLLAAAAGPGEAALLHRAHRSTQRSTNASVSVASASVVAKASTSASVAVASAAVVAKAGHNASHNLSYPFTTRIDPAVGKVWSLYYSSYSDQQITLVEARESYRPASRKTNVWLGGMILPEPTCALQLTSQTNYPTSQRKANLRLAELAICERYHILSGLTLPSCGASKGQVCEIELLAPLPSSDEHQEPWIAAAMALAAYSRLCALSQNSTYEHYKCEIHSSEQAICAGLQLHGGDLYLTGIQLPGLMDLKLSDAYMLRLSNLVLPSSSRGVYQRTQDYNNRTDVLAWQHAPPEIDFCQDLACLEAKFMPR